MVIPTAESFFPLPDGCSSCPGARSCTCEGRKGSGIYPRWAAVSSAVRTTLPLPPRALPWKQLRLHIEASWLLSPGFPQQGPAATGRGSQPPETTLLVSAVGGQKSSLGTALLGRAIPVSSPPWVRGYPSKRRETTAANPLSFPLC